MITEAIQEKLVAIIPSYSHIAPEDASAPFILHIEKGEPIRTKSPGGLSGYNYEVTVILVAVDPATRETYTAQIIAAIEALTATTTKGTKIDEALYISDIPMYDEETNLYGINILFNVITSNR